jgi:hypothetical protein
VVPKDCSAFNSRCTEGRCNAANGQCFAANINENQACDDGRFCTSNTGEQHLLINCRTETPDTWLYMYKRLK